MASYSQFFNQHHVKGVRHRVLWVCGDQGVLVDEVVATVITASGVTSTGLTRLDLSGGDTPTDVWDTAGQLPMDDAPQVTVVYDCDKITDWSPLQSWVAALAKPVNKATVLVLVSRADNFPFEPSDSPKMRPLKPWAEWINKAKAGMVVRCAMPNDTDAVAWLARIRPMSPEVALYLLARTGDNLYEAGNVAKKMAFFPGTVTQAVVDVVSYSTVKSFAEALLHFRKDAAMKAAARIHPAEIGAILAGLDNSLEDLARLNYMARTRRMGLKDQAMEFGRRLPYVKPLISCASKYDLARRASCRDTLALVDAAYRRGIREGLLETLVSSW